MKKLTIVLALTLSLLALAACGSQTSQPQEKIEPNGTLYETEAYNLILPEGITAQAGEDGNTVLMMNGEEMGGVKALAYEGAQDLKPEMMEDQAHVEKFQKLLDLVTGEEKMSYSFSIGTVGDSSVIELSAAPLEGESTPGTANDVKHFFFPKGDIFYDLYIPATVVAGTEGTVLLEGFTLK